jgi:chromosome segregation ATPase
MFKKLLKLINRHKYDQAIKETMATTIFFDQFNKTDELQEELECYSLTKKLLNLQARTDKVTIKALENALKQSNGNLQEIQEKCDYLELESNKTEEMLKLTTTINDLSSNLLTDLVPNLEKLDKELLAKDKYIAKVRAENDRLSEKLKNQNDLVKTLTADLKYKNEVIQSLESKLEKGFEATLSRGLQELSKIGHCLPKPIIKVDIGNKEKPKPSISSQITKQILGKPKYQTK